MWITSSARGKLPKVPGGRTKQGTAAHYQWHCYIVDDRSSRHMMQVLTVILCSADPNCRWSSDSPDQEFLCFVFLFLFLNRFEYLFAESLFQLLKESALENVQDVLKWLKSCPSVKIGLEFVQHAFLPATVDTIGIGVVTWNWVVDSLRTGISGFSRKITWVSRKQERIRNELPFFKVLLANNSHSDSNVSALLLVRISCRRSDETGEKVSCRWWRWWWSWWERACRGCLRCWRLHG